MRTTSSPNGEEPSALHSAMIERTREGTPRGGAVQARHGSDKILRRAVQDDMQGGGQS